jgi:hypothetical protein
LQNWCHFPLLLVVFCACACTKHMISFMTLLWKLISDRCWGRARRFLWIFKIWNKVFSQCKKCLHQNFK